MVFISRSSRAEGLYGELDQSAVFSLTKYLYLQVHEDKITEMGHKSMMLLIKTRTLLVN